MVLAFCEAGHAAPDDSTKANEKRAHRFEWRWRRSGFWDYAATTVIGATYVVVEFGTRAPHEPRWSGPILFDAAARDAFVARSSDGRNRAATISDFFEFAPGSLAVAESLIVPLAFDDWNTDVAWQLTAINLQSFAISALLARSGHHLGARRRPDVEPCREDPNYDHRCFKGSNASFPGGHPAGAFTGFGLLCAHHLNLKFFGGGAPEVAVCAVGAVGGITTAMLRLNADRHYATDVIVGSMLGIASGFVVPMLLHYQFAHTERRASSSAIRWTLTPMAAEGALGLSVYGWL